MDNIFKRFTCLFLALLMILEVFSPVTALAAEGGALFEEANPVDSTNNVEKKISDELFNKPAEKTEKTDTRKKEEVHKDSSNKPKETGKAPALIPGKKTKDDYEFFENTKKNEPDQAKAEEKAKAEAEAKAAEEAKAKEEQAAKENADLEKQRQELLRIEAERQAAAARANEAEAAAAEAEYRDARQKRIELEKLLEEKLKEKGLRDQKKQESEKSLNEEKSNKLEDKNKTEEKITEEEEEKGLLEKIKEGLGLTDLQRADKELKKALKDKDNGLEEIQALLDSFEEKYDLSREDQAKLMADNTEAFREFIERHGYENFDPQMFMVLNDDQAENEGLEISDLYKGLEDRELTQEELEAGLTFYQMPNIPGQAEDRSSVFGFFRSAVRGSESNDLNLEGKKFTIITRYDISNKNGPVKKGQSFTIHLDEKLTVNDENTLKPIKYNNEVIATPKYNSNNTITYTLTKDINENIQVPLNIPVDYNTANIKLDDDGTFTVINKVTGIGVNNPPKDLVPQKIDKNGNLAGSIIEPGRDDVTQIIGPDDSNYKVYTDVVANPVIRDRELIGYNWIIKISSDTDLDDLGYKANFTTVKGSGLGEIEDKSKTLGLKDQLNGSFGIVDSKHHVAGEGTREITYNLYTPVTGKQSAYMMDVSVVLTKKDNKLGAKRLIVDKGYGPDKVAEATPSRVGMNNRTTVFGEFTSENNAKWTVTDGVSTGDEKTTLPLEERTLENQKGSMGQTGVYKIDPTTGQMVQDTTGISGEKTVGTIAVYEYNSTLPNNKEPQTLAGVKISKYQDIYVNQKWNLDKGLTMPDMTVKAVDPNNEETVLGEATAEESQANPDPAIRTIKIEDVKVWNIANDGTASKNDLKIKQEFPTNKTHNGKAVSYYETTNWKDPNNVNTFAIANRGTVEVAPQLGNFTLIKKGEENKPLPGATFKLLGQGEAEVATDSEGKIHFQNIAPGSYRLLETKAPNGYKLNQETTYINVDENGRISASGSSAKLEVGGNPTATVAHKGYPDFMNAMQYARVNADGSVTTYIYLKANEAKTGGSTDKDTRLNLILSSGQRFNNIKDVQVYDVNPYYRDYLKKEMIQQGVNQGVLEHIGNTNVLNAPDRNPIRATLYPRDPYTEKLGYRIKFPQERFERDWGFLVVAKSPADTSVSYDWLMDDPNNTTVGNNARLENQTIRPTTAEDANKETTLTVTNEKFETRPVEVTKWDKDKKPVAGATFEIRDANGKLISTVESQAPDEKR